MLSSDLTEKRREGGSAAAAAQGNGKEHKRSKILQATRRKS